MSDASKMIEHIDDFINSSEIYAGKRLAWLKKTTSPDLFACALSYCEANSIKPTTLYFAANDSDFKDNHKFSLPWIAIDIVLTTKI